MTPAHDDASLPIRLIAPRNIVAVIDLVQLGRHTKHKPKRMPLAYSLAKVAMRPRPHRLSVAELRILHGSIQTLTEGLSWPAFPFRRAYFRDKSMNFVDGYRDLLPFSILASAHEYAHFGDAEEMSWFTNLLGHGIAVFAQCLDVGDVDGPLPRIESFKP